MSTDSSTAGTGTTPTTPTTWTAARVARLVDHTLLKPEATTADVAALLADARRLGVLAVCVSPSFLPLQDTAGPGSTEGLVVATVCGFPSGKHVSEVKAAEAAAAVAAGADEVDMVIDVGAALSGEVEAVRSDIAAVRAAVPAPGVLKVIVESAALPDDVLVAVCRAAEEAGADFVKTSTGFHPAGGASVHAVEVMHATVGGRLGIKASGGIRTAEAAVALLEAGATRLGLSGTAAVLDGLAQD
ncbi:deoxyribose-phosphate aldolase [Quadrisphaera oryzae]|uniref:deoxyribose-phosphate aldolase n=1 Tax=Quadrisphaera TaxID=317661 RepID=UPI001648D13F|nr:deoxyribose-phosphate aldolase [Quadrisphaera sp. RL12-1S]MBC3760140.1 deoxyribose-phosphate aldolase [Quadrisphaera sp. RL12-1S]